jgi:DNA repair photolyase
MSLDDRHIVHKGRGATFNPRVRFESTDLDPFDDGWESLAQARADDPPPRTEVTPDASRSVIVRNDSPDIPFDRSINPYRGCEHGCVYCYARPTHAYLGLSPGLDFETKLRAKFDAASLLERELAKPGYECQPIALGTNTDPYQPVERRLRITRGVLEVLARCRHPLTIVTKSAAVVRDLDLLAPMAREDLARVAISVTSLDGELARRLEPRAAAPHRRLQALRQLSEAGVPTAVMVAPIIPATTDHEIERILEAAAALFAAWLVAHAPERAQHVLSLVRQCRGGKLYDATFGRRMRGEGPYAQLIERRFAAAKRRFGLTGTTRPLRTDLFTPPDPDARQLRLL